jgi:hypothetical protein
VLTCAADVTIHCYENTLPDSTGTSTAVDNCDNNPAITYADVTADGPLVNGYTIERTWTATDACGNSTTCLQVITLDNPLQIGPLPLDTICSGELVTFGQDEPGFGPVTYDWNFSSGSNPSMASGIGPHNVTYTYNATNGSAGAHVVLTESIPGCFSVTDTVTVVHVNAIPNAAISGLTSNLCYYTPRSFKPVAAEMTGFSYQWDFGNGASPATASTYGPHLVQYSTTGPKTIKLIVFSNESGSSCGDTTMINLTVIACPGNVTGRVRKSDGTGITSVNVRIFPDVNEDGEPDAGAAFKSTFTTMTGGYALTGIPYGQWVVVQTDLPGYFSLIDIDETDDFDSIVNSNQNDNWIPVTMKANEVDADNNFVDVVSPGIISGYVFQDFNSSGQPDNGEGISSVVINLYSDLDSNGVPDLAGLVATTTTTSIGFYTFGNLTTGHYVIMEEQPATFTSVMDIDLTNDLDVVPNTNMLDDLIPVTLVNAETDAQNFFKESGNCSHVVTNTNDSGPGSLRDMIECSNPGETITFENTLAGATIMISSERLEINKNVFIDGNVSPRIKIASSIPGAFYIAPGISAEFKNIDITSGLTGEAGAAFENYGQLTLWDLSIFRNPSLPDGNYLIFNSSPGMVITKGMIKLEVE